MKEFGSLKDMVGPVAVGIDQSYTGFATTLVDGNANFYSTVYTSSGKGVHRLQDLRKRLSIVIGDAQALFGVTEVAMEGYAPGAKFGREKAGELGGLVKLTLADISKIYPLIVTPAQLKKYATGSGTAKKAQVMVHVLKKWDVLLDDDNAADSYVLARMAAGLFDHKYEEDVIRSLHREVQ